MESQSVSHWAGIMLSVELCLATTRSRIFKALIGRAVLNNELAATRWTRVRRDTISMIGAGTGVVERYGRRQKDKSALVLPRQ